MNEKIWDVFISYKQDPDAESAHDLLEALEHAGLKCWIAPRDIRSTIQEMAAGGGGWDDAIPYAIEHSRAMVILVSSSAMKSKQIQKEIYLGDDAAIPFFPVLIEDVPLERSFKYHLGRSQWNTCLTGNGSNRFVPFANEVCDSLGIEDTKAQVPQVQSNVMRTATSISVDCSACGAINSLSAKFCHICGKPIQAKAVQQISAAPESPSLASEPSAQGRPSAKKHLRALFSGSGGKFSISDLTANGVYSVSNVKTCISDLKNPKYAGGDVMVIETDGESYWKA